MDPKNVSTDHWERHYRKMQLKSLQRVLKVLATALMQDLLILRLPNHRKRGAVTL